MIDVKVDMTQLSRTFSALGAGVKPAMAKTMNIVTFSARKELSAGLDKYMITRGTWSERGMQAVKATPANLVSEVGSTREYLVDQVVGGARDGHLAVPMVGSGLPRTTAKSRVPKSKFPKVLQEKSKRHIVVLKTKESMGLWREVGSKKNPRLDLLYVFPEKTQIKARWPMFDIIYAKATSRLPSAIKEAWANWTRGLSR